MWWWGPCAGASCCTDVSLPSRSAGPALYDELVALLTDHGRRDRGRSVDATDEDTCDDAFAALGLRASASGIAVEPGIYRARDVRTHDPVALKVFDKALLKHQAARRRLRQEIKILQQCGDHTNILRLYGVYASKRTFQIAFELARGGEVMHRIVAASGPQPSVRYRVTEREIARIVASAASAIQYMHKRGLVHGEIRPEHLLYSDLEPDARVVLVDFGRATPWRKLTFRSRVHGGGGRRARRRFLWHDRHSLKFLPPAVLRRVPADGVPDWQHAQQVDVWSLGVTMFVLLCGAFPFDGTSLEEIRDHILTQALEFPSRHDRGRSHSSASLTGATDVPRSSDASDGVRMSRAARDLLLKLLEKDPYASPSIEDVCAHPWLSSDVAADVRWSDSQLDDFGAFAQNYTRAVAASSLRRPTLDHETMGSSWSQSSSSRMLHDHDHEELLHARPPVLYDVYGIPSVNGNGTHDIGDDDDFDAEAERPSFVSTDGNIQVHDADERPSADAYMRLASAELEALAVRKAAAASPSPQHGRQLSTEDKPPVQQRKSRAFASAGGSGESLPSVEEDGPHAAVPVPSAALKGDMWPLFSRPRRLFSFKSLSFRSTSSGSREDDP